MQDSARASPMNRLYFIGLIAAAFSAAALTPTPARAELTVTPCDQKRITSDRREPVGFVVMNFSNHETVVAMVDAETMKALLEGDPSDVIRLAYAMQEASQRAAPPPERPPGRGGKSYNTYARYDLGRTTPIETPEVPDDGRPTQTHSVTAIEAAHRLTFTFTAKKHVNPNGFNRRT